MRHLLLVVLSLAALNFVQAQVTTNFNNTEKMTARGKFGKSFRSKAPYTIPAQDVKALVDREARDYKPGEAKPFRIAEPVKVNIDVVKEAAWVEEDGFAHGKYTIVASGAKSISANFDRFRLPPGAELYVYSANGEMITGPVTAKENNRNNFWGTWVYKGEELTVDFKVPVEVKSQLRLHVSSVAYGYKELYVSNFGQSAACNTNVLCVQGNGWENERSSVALILDANSAALCTGALINNTCNTNTPNFLTANHCFDGGTANWKFTFLAWSPTCTPSQNANGVTFNGSTLRARNAASDFCLVELNQTPASNSGITYAGWSRANATSPSGVSITHPRGDVMKIATYTTAPTQETFLSSNDWRVTWANGTVEPGSSGGPLFNNNHQIMGQVHGGNPSDICTANDHAFFGRFDLSWTGGGTNATRLSNWLDPTNTGAMTTNTRGIPFITSPDPVCTTGNFVLQNQPAGTTVTWSTSNSSALTINSAGVATRQNNFNGQVTVTAAIGGACNDTFTRTVWVGKPTSPGAFTVISGNLNNMCINSQAQVLISSVPGAVSYVWTSNDPSGLQVDGSGLGALITGLTTSVNSPLGYWTFNYGGANSCGSNTALYGVVIKNCRAGGGGQLRAASFPNPSNESFTVQVKEEESKEQVEISLFNSTMERVFTTTTDEKELIISTSTLLPGHYYLKIVTGKEVTHRQIIVNH